MTWPWTKNRCNCASDLAIVANRRLAAVLAVVAKDDPELLKALGLSWDATGTNLRDSLVQHPAGEEYVVTCKHAAKEKP